MHVVCPYLIFFKSYQWTNYRFSHCCGAYCKAWPSIAYMWICIHVESHSVASLPSPSHPLLMFRTESEPCQMCTQTSTWSTLLLPGRGSDYLIYKYAPALGSLVSILTSLLTVLTSLSLTPAHLLQLLPGRFDFWFWPLGRAILCSACKSR